MVEILMIIFNVIKQSTLNYRGGNIHMYCPECGKKLDGAPAVCPFCGKQNRVEDTSSGVLTFIAVAIVVLIICVIGIAVYYFRGMGYY